MILAIGFALLLLLLLVRSYQEDKRLERLGPLATKLGLTYEAFEARPDPRLLGRLQGFRLLQDGYQPSVSHVMRGERGRWAVTLFDHHYSEVIWNRRYHYTQTALLLESSGLRIPTFRLRPRTLAQRGAYILGGREFRLEHSPEFFRRFVLEGSDAAALRDFFTPDLLTYLTPLTGLALEGSDHRLLLYRPQRILNPDTIPQMLNAAIAIGERLQEAAPLAFPLVGEGTPFLPSVDS